MSERRYFASVFTRIQAVVVVAWLVAVIGGLPGLATTAHAAPRTVTVATYDLEPFVMSKGDIKTGYTIDLLDQIAKRTGWTFNYVDGDNVQGLMKAVAEGRAEMAACNISITADREKRFDFSQPIIAAGLQIIVPADSTERSKPGLIDFLKLLFSETMLVWLFAALVLTIVPAHIIWFLERRGPGSRMSPAYFPGIFQAFEWGLGMMAAAPVDEPRRWLTRTVSVLWTFVSLIFVAYYTAILTANLTVEKIESKIGSPGDLIGKTVCTVAETTSPAALAKLGIESIGMPRIEDCYAGMRNRKFEAVVFDAPVLRYYVAHDGAGVAELAGPVFKNEDYGILFPIGSRLADQVDQALLSVQEDGEYDLLRQKWFGAGE